MKDTRFFAATQTNVRMTVRTLLVTMLLVVGSSVLRAQTDVTSTYLTNAGFDTGLITSNQATGSNSTVEGWTVSGTQPQSCGAAVPFKSSFTLNGFYANTNTVPFTTDKFGNSLSAGALGISTGWQQTIQYTQEVTLPAGNYKLVFDVINRYDGTNHLSSIGQNLYGWIPDEGTATYSDVVQFPYDVWVTLSVEFTLTEETTGKISVGQKGVNNSSNKQPVLFTDCVKIYRMDTGRPTKAHPVDYSDLINQTTWSYDENGSSGSASALTTNVNEGEWTGVCAERYRGNPNHYGKKLFQSVSLPAGVYEVKAACMSAAANGVEGENALADGTTDNAYFYANSEETTYPLANATSKYMSQIVTLDADGSIEFGVKTEAVGANWSAIGSATIVKLANSEEAYNGDPELSEDETYYLYNPQGNGYLREANNWGTKASLKPYGGLALTFEESANGYKVYVPVFGENIGLGSNLFVDNGSPCEWDVLRISDGVYTLYNSDAGGYLASDGIGNALVTVASVTDAAKWNIVTKTERTEALAAATEDNPLDATYFITNPDFSRNLATTGWTVTSGGGATGADGDNTNFNWQQWNSTFDIHQSLSGLPSGTYQLKAQGFYRPCGNGTESTDQNAMLYAGDVFSTPIQLVASEGKAAQDNTYGFTTANANSGSTVYVPNSQSDATKAFDSGAYDANSLIFVVGEDGTVNIGGSKTVLFDNDWTVIDNFRLFYLGDTVTTSSINAIILPEGQMNVNVKQAMLDARDSLVANPTLANFAVLASCIAAAESSIEDYEVINTYITNLNTAVQRGIIPESYVTASAFCLNYSNGSLENTGTYTSSSEVVAAWRAMVTAYWKANTVAANNDMTAFIVNQGFEMDGAPVSSPQGWTITSKGSDCGSHSIGASGSTYYMTNAVGTYLFNNWIVSATTLDISQQMTGLPSGTYQISVVVAGSNGNVVVRSNGQTASQAVSAAATGIEVTLETFVTSNGTLDMQVYNTVTSGNTFFKVDNFRLTYVSSEVSSTLFDNISLPTGQMNSDVYGAMQTAYTTLSGEKTTANYEALVAAIQNAEASIAVYANIADYFDKLNTANQRGGIPADTYKSYPVYTNYTNGSYANTGTYTSLSEVIPLYRTFVSTYWDSHKAANADMTAFIVNQGFEFGAGSQNDGQWEGWTNPWHYAENDVSLKVDSPTPPEGTYCANLWSINATLYSTMSVKQDLTGLPEGQYELTVYLAGYEGKTVTLTGGEESADVTMAAGNTFQTETLTCFVESDGALTVMVSSTRQDGKTFFKADDFRLKYISETVTLDLPTKEEGTMKRSIRDTEDAAYTAFESSKTPANYRAAIAAYNDAVYSVACYAKAAATFAKVENLLSKTNVYTYDAYKTFYTPYSEFLAEYNNRTMENYLASTLEYTIFGNRTWHQTNIMVVPFLGSAWDHAGDYTWTDYWVNTWSTEGDTDGSSFTVPFVEYWSESALAAKNLTATALGTSGNSYTVTADIRLQTTDGSTPTGITLQVGNGTLVTITGTRVGTTNFYLTTGASATGTADSEGVKIKVIVAEGTNVSWVALQSVWVDYSSDGAPNQEDLATAITNASGKKLGFLEGEYAPYTNVSPLLALQAAEALRMLGNAAPPALVTAAINDLTNATWTANTEEEMNAVFWTDDYSAEDVYTVTFYTDEGETAGTFNCLDPTGWDLDGRADAYNTRILKYRINANDKGLRAIDDETGLFIKYNTNYGEDVGYTMPLEPNTKYSLSFIYSCWGEDKDIKTKVKIFNKRTKQYVTLTEVNGFDGYTKNDFTESGKEGTTDWYIRVNMGAEGNLGNTSARNWDIFRGYFTTSSNIGETNDEYVIEFEKDRDFAHNTLYYQGYLTEQYQITLGDIYILRYNDDVTFLDGSTTNVTDGERFTFTKESKGRNIELKRSISKDKWNTLALPFKLIWREMNRLLGVDSLFYYKGTSLSGHYAVLNFEGIDNGLHAATPVLIKTKENVSIAGAGTNGGLVFNNFILKADDPVTEDPNNLFDFTGTYDMVSIPQWAVYIKNNELIQKTVEGGNSWMQPTRAYFTIDSTVENPAGVKLMSFNVDNIETGIMAIEPDGRMTVTSGNIYDLNGRMVRQNAKSLEGLKPGVYVVDGRKVFIR